MCKINVLIVDDNEEFSKGLQEKLILNGFTAEYCLSGEDSLKIIKNRRDSLFDVIICDLIMPGMSGDKVFESIRDIDPNICFIMLTGHGSITSAIEILKMGAYSYFTKPILEEKYEEFFLTIKRGVTQKKIRLMEEKVLTTTDINLIFDYVIELVEIIFSSPEFYLAIIEDEGNRELRIRKQKGFRDKPVLKIDGFIKYIFEEKKPLFLKKIDKENRSAWLPLSEDSESLLAIPLIVLDKIYGILEIEGTKANLFTNLDMEDFKQFSNALAVALYNNKIVSEKEKNYNEFIAAFNAITHRFKIPLYNIRLIVGSFLSHPDTMSMEKIKKGLEEIDEYVENANDMIKKILLNYKDDITLVNLVSIFTKVKRSLCKIASEKGIEIIWPDNKDIDVNLNVKTNQLSFIFETIIENSFDAISKLDTEDRKSGRIEIISKIMHHKIELGFMDNGIGIKDNLRHKIFNKIFSTKPDNIGNGIGLFLCKQFIQGHNGEIWFESKPGDTRFYIVLPIKQSD